MQCELYSRDFTCNALLLSLDLKNILDPTGLGLNDIQKKTIRTCLPAAITLGIDNKRIVRIIYLAAKLNFNIDEEIIKWIKTNPNAINNCKKKYLTGKLQKAVDSNLEKTVQVIDQLGLWNTIPTIPALTPYMSRRLK
jgi:tRNA nucleotidyltransferase/poly(A) polymerase